ncbi:hypothetical protein PAT3040_05775 [Paenibacillus agaridevorans]|uniref:Uncharacterized protein n=1 Tax=Paenibacillus agaridevorans TaxID=171404 RepID=A0A2R5F0U3_9BACL|nr:hypothetical protein [Paenibacillus agaridevorans]GBG10998.1 hypothetical protein PAT3040_05775 [Paenibacillus agaridevorans]
MKFSYKLSGIGWADVHLQIEDSEIYINTSYLSEPLIDLVRSIEYLLPECTPMDEVKDVVQFEWNSEPAIHRWRFEKTKNGKVQIEIVVYVDGLTSTPGKLEFKEECEIDLFIKEVIFSLEGILKQHGIVGYRKQWYAGDFPISSYLQLRNYLLHKSNFTINIKNQDEWNECIESNLSNELEIIKTIL